MHAKVVGATSFVVAGRPSCVSWKGGDGGGKKEGTRVVKRIGIGKRVGGFELTSRPSGTLSHATD